MALVPGFLSLVKALVAESRRALAVGAPGSPGLRMRSPDPASIRFLLAWMLSHNPLAIYFFGGFLPLPFPYMTTSV